MPIASRVGKAGVVSLWKDICQHATAVDSNSASLYGFCIEQGSPRDQSLYVLQAFDLCSLLRG